MRISDWSSDCALPIYALAQLLDGDTGVVPLELGQRRGGLLHLAGLSVEGGQHAVGPGDARAGAQALLHQRARLAILVALTVRGGHAKVEDRKSTRLNSSH